MTIVRFTHGTLTGRPPVYVRISDVTFWYRSPNSAATHLVASGGAIIPVLESCEEVSQKVSGINQEATVTNEGVINE